MNKRPRPLSGVIRRRAYARVGIAGNPSDGYGGRTISVTIANYHADVEMRPRADGVVRFIPNPECDLSVFDGGLAALRSRVARFGYDGAIPLLAATCKQFVDACLAAGLELDSTLGFDVEYTTNIPRQRGLAGSSAICTAMFRSLMDLHGVQFNPEMVAKSVWNAERLELKLKAGLQDRVVQAFTGCVAMDFDRTKYAEGSGLFRRIPTKGLEEALFLLVTHKNSNPKSSSSVFNDVGARFERGDADVIKGMADLGNLALEAEAAIVAKQWDTLAKVMNRNFDIRCALFGAVVSPQDRAVVAKAQALGAGAKLPGSGGCVLVLAPTDNILAQVQDTFREEGHEVVRMLVAPEQ